MTSSSSAIVLLSGGLDSATCLAVAHRDGFSPTALSFRYGQRNEGEVDAAGRLARAAGVEQVVVDLDLAAFGGSALTDRATPVPGHDRLEDALAAGVVPTTYVPARNTIFLSIALALAEARGARDVFIGVNAIDYSGYPDCRPEFVAAFEALARVATRAGVEGDPLRVRTPLIELGKADIVRLAVQLGVDLALTTSCYDPGPAGAACHRCDACLLRARGFQDAGVADPGVAR